jgi:hypothetical protein
LPSVQLIPARQRITLDKTAFVDDEKTLDDYGVKEGDSLFVKDLGPQISWRTVFLVEYVRPTSTQLSISAEHVVIERIHTDVWPLRLYASDFQAGPLVIHPLFYFFGQQIYGGIARLAGERLVPYEHSNMQKYVLPDPSRGSMYLGHIWPLYVVMLHVARVALGLVLLHFAKREYETVLWVSCVSRRLM